MPNMDYSLIQRTPDGTGKILVTTPGIPNKGSYVLESDMKIYTNQGMVAIADIVDDLVTADAAKPLSANQGVVLKQLIDAFSGGIVPKGDILSTNLPPADDTNKGWQYYCTDTNQWATSDGTQWIMTSNNVITQTPDATDTGHALSNAVVTQCCNEVKGKLNQHESRLENLEQKAGDYTTVQYRGTNAVPTGKAKYGLVKSFVGKSRAWNQLISGSSIASDTKGLSITYSNGQFTVSGTTTGTGNVALAEAGDYYSGHVYLLCGFPSGLSGIVLNRFLGTGANITDSGDGAIQTATVDGSDSAKIRLQITAPVGTSFNFSFKPIFRDLTPIFPEGVPSTIAECVQKCPDLLKNDAYNTSLVDETLSGAESVGFNRWDEVWEVGSIDADTGDNYDAPIDRIRSKNYIPVTPLRTYYIIFPGAYYGYDINKVFVGALTRTDSLIDIPQNVAYMRFRGTSTYGNVYKNDICINISQPNTSVTPHNGDYVPYEKHTIALSETVTLRSGGSVVDVLDVESGIASKNIKQICLNVGSEMITSFTNIAYLKVSVSDSANLSVSGGNFTSTLPLGRTSGTYDDAKYIGTICRAEQHVFYVGFAVGTTLAQAQTAMANHYVNYEIATPTTESIDPIIENFIEVEGGGTIDTIQTQSPVIDNCLDVGYLTV